MISPPPSLCMTATAISTSLTIWPAVDNCQLTAPMFRVPRFPAPCETALNSFKATRQVTDAGTTSLDCPLLYSVILHTVTFCSALLPSGKSPVVVDAYYGNCSVTTGCGSSSTAPLGSPWQVLASSAAWHWILLYLVVCGRRQLHSCSKC